MRHLRAAIILIFVSILSTVGPASADEVVFQNGDTITGSFVELEAGTLVFDTGYAGQIEIEADQVRRLTTDAPVVVTLQDGTTRSGDVFLGSVPAAGDPLEGDAPADGIEMAQVKAITTEPTPPIRFSGRANVGITKESGNVDTDQYRIDGELVARTNLQRFTVGGNFSKEQAEDQTTVDNWKAYGLYDYFFKPKWFLNANTLFENDVFADLDLRTTLGAGVGHQFFESEDLNLSASAGLAYIMEDYIVAENNDFSAAQWLVSYDQFFFDRFVQLFHSNNGYISLEDSDDWFINTRQGVRFPFYRGLFTSLQYNYSYQNTPSPEANSKWQSAFMVLLGYQFGN